MSLSREDFDSLLTALDPADRTQAGVAYEKLRHRLICFFGWEACHPAEDWADEVLNRVAKRIGGGERIQSMTAFVSGVARLVAKEAARQRTREQSAVREMPVREGAGETPDDRTIQCLERCLDQLDGETKSLILRYYEGSASARIRQRQRMAAELGISLNSLRNRALRLRDKLESCIAACMERDVSGSGDTQ